MLLDPLFYAETTLFAEKVVTIFYYEESILAAQAIPPVATHFSVAWSVCLSSVTFVPLLRPKLFD